MHRLLQRQIKRSLGRDFDISSLDENIQTLLKNISSGYDNYDKDKKLLEHILEINSSELNNANKMIKDKNLQTLSLLAQYKDAIDNTLIVSKTDISGTISYVNQNFCDISGYSEDELISKSHSIIHNPKEDSEIFSNMWKTILNKQVWHGSFSNIKKDGSLYYVNSTISPILDIKGDIVEFISLLQDVTQRTLLEQKSLLATKRLQQIMDSQESIVIISNDKGIAEVNHKFYDLTGFSNLEAFKEKHTCICELFINKDGYLSKSTQGYRWTDPLFENNNSVHKALIKNTIGEKLVFDVTATTIELDDGQYILTTFSDITSIEKMREKSEQAEKAKTQFLANMSHELRTPLNAIIGFSQILQRNKDLEEKPKSYIDKINNSGNKLLQLINSILDFSKIESGEVELEAIEFNLYETLISVITQVEVIAKDKGLDLYLNYPDDVSHTFIGDSLRISQVLINLLSNAVKFTDQGSINLYVKQLRDNRYQFRVQDTGIGLSDAQKEKLFKPFSQADSSTSRIYGGTGLGLSISKELIELMDGSIWIESEVGKGTSFIFEIELKDIELCEV